MIVDYRGDRYVNEEIYSKLREDALATYEKRNKLYQLGETIELRDYVDSYFIRILAVEVDISEDVTRHDIKIAVESPNSIEHNDLFFAQIETKNGLINKDFTLVDNETVRVVLPEDDNITMITLRAPRHSKCIRQLKVTQ